LVKFAKSPSAIAEKYFTSVLPPKKMQELELLMRRKTKLAKLAEIIQHDWGYFHTLTPNWLINKLASYQRHVFKGKVLKQNPEEVKEISKKLDLSGKVDALFELANLVIRQQARAMRAIDAEESLPATEMKISYERRREARSEIKLFASLLEKLAELQMETGQLRRAPKIIEGEYLADEKDPKKMNFKVTETFMETLDLIGQKLGEGADKEFETLVPRKGHTDA